MMKTIQEEQKSEKKLVLLGNAKKLTKGNFGAYREGWDGGWRYGDIP